MNDRSRGDKDLDKLPKDAICENDRIADAIQPLIAQDTHSKRILMALGWWRQTGGVLCRHDLRLNALFASLQIFADTGRYCPPPLLCVGPNCALGRMFAEVATNERICAVNTGSFSESFLRVSQSRTPELEYVRVQLITEDPEPIWLSYRRLILPGQLSVGGREIFLVLYEIERALRCMDGGRHAPVRLSDPA